jgi:cell division protein FtsB
MTDYQTQRIQNRVAAQAAPAIGFGEMSRYLALAVALAALLIAYPWIHSEILKHGYQIQDLKRENTLLQEQHQALLLEEAACQSPQLIDEYARERLGLVPASSAQVILIHESESLPGLQMLAQTVPPARPHEATQ